MKVSLLLKSIIFSTSLSKKTGPACLRDISSSLYLNLNFRNLEWILRSELMLKKGWVILANKSQSQNCEWPSLARIPQPFYSINSLLITNSRIHNALGTFNFLCSFLPLLLYRAYYVNWPIGYCFKRDSQILNFFIENLTQNVTFHVNQTSVSRIINTKVTTWLTL